MKKKINKKVKHSVLSGGIPILFSLAFCSFTFLILASLPLTPYYYYEKIMQKGIKGSYITVDKKLIDNIDFLRPRRTAKDIRKNSKFWKSLHFSDFKISFPLGHPLLKVTPEITYRGQYKRSFYGANFSNLDGKIIFRFMERKLSRFNLRSFYSQKENKLFDLPINRSYLEKIPVKKIWPDIFKRKIGIRFRNFRKKIISTPFNFYKNIKLSDYRYMLYDLYILKLREWLFKKMNISEKVFTYLKSKNGPEVGLIKAGYKKGDLNEVIILLHDGLIYSFDIKTNIVNPLGKEARSTFVSNINFVPKDQDSARLIYGKYQKLSYEKKISDDGMTYLYAAMTQLDKQKGFLKSMIKFLERGKGNAARLFSLYQYAYKRFGSTFSSRNELLKENANQELGRKISEEIEKEVNALEKNTDIIDVGNFENIEQEMKYFLDKAKEKGHFIEDDDDILEMN